MFKDTLLYPFHINQPNLTVEGTPQKLRFCGSLRAAPFAAPHLKR